MDGWAGGMRVVQDANERYETLVPFSMLLLLWPTHAASVFYLDHRHTHMRIYGPNEGGNTRTRDYTHAYIPNSVLLVELLWKCYPRREHTYLVINLHICCLLEIISGDCLMAMWHRVVWVAARSVKCAPWSTCGIGVMWSVPACDCFHGYIRATSDGQLFPFIGASFSQLFSLFFSQYFSHSPLPCDIPLP